MGIEKCVQALIADRYLTYNVSSLMRLHQLDRNGINTVVTRLVAEGLPAHIKNETKLIIKRN